MVTNPGFLKAEYTTDGETWMQFGSDVKPAAGRTVTFKADKGTVECHEGAHCGEQRSSTTT